jgi:DNA-binding response OmpR family regulator
MSLYKVLVVDDELEIVRAIGMRLQSAGYEVVSATDGAMATELVTLESPDLVILDLGMPCIDGHTVAGRLRDHVKTLLTPIIFLTARTTEEDRTRAYQVGAVAYLTKPFQSYELLNAVSRAASVSRRIRSAECLHH